MTPLPIDHIVDLDRYPIDALTAPAGQRLIARCRSELAACGVASLPGFVRPAAVAQTIVVADALADSAWHANRTHNVYFTDPPTSGVATSDPRRRRVRSSQRAIAYDLLPDDAPVRTLYAYEPVVRFLQAVLDVHTLHRSADPLDAVQISHFMPGDELGWHFDNSEFSVTLMLREPDAGGHFEWHPGLRSTQAENFSAVEAALDGRLSPQRLATAPGTLAIFQGRHALHRVTPVEGATTRVNAVFTFGAEPNMCLTASTQELFYGRRVEAV